MSIKDKKRTTIHIDPEIWEQARLKATCSGSRLIEELLITYIGNDGNILSYEEKIRQSEEIIRQEQAKINQYKQAIKELEELQKANGENAKILSECLERIKRYNTNNGFVTIQFLKRLSKVKLVSITVLNDLCLNHGFTIKSIEGS